MENFCSKCGAEIGMGEKFCGFCGNPIPQDPPIHTIDAVYDPVKAAEYQEQRNFAQMQNNGAYNGSFYQGNGMNNMQQPPYPHNGMNGRVNYAGYSTSVARTKREYLALPQNTHMRKEINTAGIICYVAAGIEFTSALCLLAFIDVKYALLEVMFMLGMGLGIQIGKSYVCAIILTIYSIINTLYYIYAYNTPGGILILIAGIFAWKYTKALNDGWNAYKRANRIY